MQYLQTAWEYSSFKFCCGSYLSLVKVKHGEFQTYGDLFTPVFRKKKTIDFHVRTESDLLCVYCIGSGKILYLYQKIRALAFENDCELMGNCYETGLNELAISDIDENITQIEIPCRRKSNKINDRTMDRDGKGSKVYESYITTSEKGLCIY